MVCFRNLKYLRINDLPNVGNKALVSLLLQEDNPDLTVLGVDLEALDYMTENSQTLEGEGGRDKGLSFFHKPLDVNGTSSIILRSERTARD